PSMTIWCRAASPHRKRSLFRLRLVRSRLLLLYHRHADHPDLHSFPTRRSSDLLLPPDDLVDGLICRFRWPTWPPASQSSTSDWRDRKSTRLNSSHVEISYAVFCLKKKKKTESCLNYGQQVLTGQ